MFGRIVLAGAGSLIVAVAGAFFVAGSQWQTAHALTNCTTSGQALNANEQTLFAAINAYRVANGRSSLEASPNLSRAAAWHGEDMLAEGYFSHTDSLGRSAFLRITNCGYGSTGAGEILAYAGSATGAMSLWKGSPGHNSNMLNANWTVMGVAQVGPYWIVDFGNLNDSDEPWDSPNVPTSTPTAIRTAVPTPSPTPTQVVPVIQRRASVPMVAAE